MSTTPTTDRDALAKQIFTVDNSQYKGDMDVMWSRAQAHSTLPGNTDAAYAYAIADGLLAAGYRKVDHIEYAADHKHSDLEFQDEDGNLWMNEDDFREYYEEYGSVTLVQRSVTAWEPLA